MIRRRILGRRYLLNAGILVLVAAASVLGQVATGAILGVVADPSGGGIGGATVTVSNPSTGLTRAFTTESDGSYRFPDLPIGTYNVDVSHSGFRTASQTGLTLTVGQQSVLDLTLQLGSTEQTVTVTAAPAMIDTTTSALGSLVSEQGTVNPAAGVVSTTAPNARQIQFGLRLEF
jgi:Carboxypeptidase regulatory-like domain